MAESDTTNLSGGIAKRGAKRDSLFLLTTVERENGTPLGRARVRNLSESGLMADCDAHLADGDRIVIELRGIGRVSGRVTWVRGDRIGMHFDNPIDPQAARKPVHVGPTDNLPPYLRQLTRNSRFPR